MPNSARAHGHSAALSIGQVLDLLHCDFADLSPSKLRFLEEQGLVTPNRTQSGYRKFTQAHVERLRLILTLQREHYLPLKVIAEVLEEVDAGHDPVIPGAALRNVSSILSPSRVLTREELLRLTGAPMRLLVEAVSAGLLPAADVYPHDAVAELSALVRLAEQGISPRHLRSMRASCERDTQLIAHAGAARGMRADTPSGVEHADGIAALLDTVRAGVTRRLIRGADTSTRTQS